MKINPFTNSGMEKLAAALDEVQRRAKVRTISADDVKSALLSINKKLDIPKKHLDGVQICVDIHAQTFPSAYKYRPESTQFVAVNIRGTWYVTGVSRSDTMRPTKAVLCRLTDEAKAALVESRASFAL